MATGRTSGCGLQYYGSRVHPKNGDLIEKKVSERTAKLSRQDVVSPFFLPPRSVLINASGQLWRDGANIGLWAAISLISRVHPKNGDFIEKGE